MKKYIILCLSLLFLLTACAPKSTPTPEVNETSIPTSTPEPPAILPHSLYYLAEDATGAQQIHRLERDGKTITQITSEQGGVENFNISPTDDSIVYFSSNTILIVDTNGENPQILEENLLSNAAPIWSPDRKKIAYKLEKVAILYSLDNGEKESLFIDAENEGSWFSSFSPDGNKIAFRKYTVPSAPGGSVYIYDLTQHSITEFPRGKSCYNDVVLWASSETLFCYGHSLAGGAMPGLFRMNAVDGSVETLIFSETMPPFLMVNAPRQDREGNLYYLYTEIIDSANLLPASSIEYFLVRSATDGVTDRIKVREESFTPSRAIWTPDGNALLIIQEDELFFVPIDPSLPIFTIMDNTSKMDTYSLEWGQ